MHIWDPTAIRNSRVGHSDCFSSITANKNLQQAIINVQKNWILWTASRSGCETMSHHRGLKDLEFQTGNSLITLQKWSCEVWSWWFHRIFWIFSKLMWSSALTLLLPCHSAYPWLVFEQQFSLFFCDWMFNIHFNYVWQLVLLPKFEI